MQHLRDYQSEAVAAIETSWAVGKTPLVAVATGGGKTTIFSELLRRVCKPDRHRALILAHTEEIIYQSAARVANQFEGRADVGIVLGDQKDFASRIVSATRQSLHKAALPRLLDYGKIDYLIIDECHHASADSYLEIAKTLKEHNPAIKIAGFTATPLRGDKRALAMLFDEIAYTWSIMDGIRSEYLTPIAALTVQTAVDLSDIKSVNGDYDKKRLAAVLDTSNWIDKAVEAWQKHGEDRQTLAFFPEVVMSRAFALKMNTAGVATRHIDANTPKEDRRAILNDYQQGKIKVISNVMVLTEGFDAPQTACILWGRPTRSKIVLTQAVGRGLRPHPTKTACLVIDLVAKDTKLLTAGNLSGKQQQCPACGVTYWAGLPACPKCGCPAPKVEKLKKPDDEQNPFRVVKRKEDHGGALVTRVTSLFEKMRAAWYRSEDDEYSAVLRLGKEVLFVLPPRFNLEDYSTLQARLGRGKTFLADYPADQRWNLEYKRAERLYQQLFACWRMIDHYTLWVVKEKTSVKNGDDPVSFADADVDIIALLERGDDLFGKAGGDQGSERMAKWRLADPTDAQKKLLSMWGAPEGLNRGDAGRFITHKISKNTLNRYLASILVKVRS